MSPMRLSGRSAAQSSMTATWGRCSGSGLGCVQKLNSPFSAFFIHATSCFTPPKGITPPLSRPCLARFATVPHPAIGRLASSKATQIMRKAISPSPWKEREDSNGARPSKTKRTIAARMSEPRTQRSGVSGHDYRLLRCAACAARTAQDVCLLREAHHDHRFSTPASRPGERGSSPISL